MKLPTTWTSRASPPQTRNVAPSAIRFAPIGVSPRRCSPETWAISVIASEHEELNVLVQAVSEPVELAAANEYQVARLHGSDFQRALTQLNIVEVVRVVLPTAVTVDDGESPRLAHAPTGLARM